MTREEAQVVRALEIFKSYMNGESIMHRKTMSNLEEGAMDIVSEDAYDDHERDPVIVVLTPSSPLAARQEKREGWLSESTEQERERDDWLARTTERDKSRQDWNTNTPNRNREKWHGATGEVDQWSEVDAGSWHSPAPSPENGVQYSDGRPCWNGPQFTPEPETPLSR